MIRVRAILLLLAACCWQASGQSVYTPGQRASAPAQTGDITLTGKVVNSVTGEGIPRALVEIGGMQGRSQLTDSSGKFQFEDLPEMQALVNARKPGYFTDQEISRGYRMKPVAVTEGMGAITIPLIPAGVVTGHVTRPDADPVEGAFVRLKAQMIVQGRKQWVERGGTRTDEDGAFRIANLVPGKYYLFSDGTVRMTGPPDEAYAPAYYPGVADISGAVPIQVQPGQAFNADLTLQPEKAYRVTGVVSGMQAGQMAMIRVVGSGNENLPIQAMVRPDGGFEIPRIPAGTYTLKALAQGRMGFMGGMGGGGGALPRPAQNYTGSVPINVSGDLTGIAIPLQPAATIPVTVKTDFTNTQTNESGGLVSGPDSQRSFRQFVHITLQRVDGENGNGSQFDPNGNMTIRDVEPGRYHVEFSPMGSNIYVASATFGNTDLLHDDLVISSGGDQQAIEVTLRDDAASVAGTADCGNTQCWVLVIPESTAAVAPRQVFVAPTGTFQAIGLPPGSYHVYAFDRIDGIEYANPDAMKAYDGAAETVTLTAGQKSQVSVTMTKVADQ